VHIPAANPITQVAPRCKPADSCLNDGLRPMRFCDMGSSVRHSTMLG
jgi:hypothetical protein